MAVAPLLHVITESFPDRPGLEISLSRALLVRAAAGSLPETVRLSRPGPIVAFGRQDRNDPGYERAVRAAREAGFEAAERLAGGRPAVFHEGTIAFARTTPARDPTARTHARFREMAEVVAAALRRIGVDARVGEVPGEYCPGEYSVNARGRTKLAGIGQRLVTGAAHLGGVLVVSGADRVRDVLVPVYEALRLPWDPSTTGSVEDELGPVAHEHVEQAILTELAARYRLEEVALDAETLALAEELEAAHVAPAPGAPAAASGRRQREGASGMPR